jgi:hypothetical protein
MMMINIRFFKDLGNLLAWSKALCNVSCPFHFLYCEKLLASRPSFMLEDHPLSVFLDCLFNTFAATLRIWRTSLHPQPEDAPCHGDRGPYNVGSCAELSITP